MGGALPYQRILELLQQGVIQGATPEHVQPASLDCSISEEIYRMRGSFLPRRGERVRDLIALGKLYKADLQYPLEVDGVYLVRLEQSVRMPQGVEIYNNNKSSSGRVNLQARLLGDGVNQYDRIPAEYAGELWLEISPRSFSVKLYPGDRINQLRFFTGNARLTPEEHHALYQSRPAMYRADGSPVPYQPDIFMGPGLTMTLDLDLDIIGYQCLPRRSTILDFRSFEHNAQDFFDPIPRPRDGMLVLDRNAFYILVTKERISVPHEYAVEMLPYDPTKGEFRTHYAGFFDPGFGYGDGSMTGTRAVLEVFTHDAAFIMRDGQPMLNMVYERLTDKAERVYDQPGFESHYQHQQGPTLSKHFKRV